MKRIFAFLLTLSCSCSFAQEKYTLSGTVTDCEKKTPVSGVIIKIIGSDKSSCSEQTDSLGNYSFEKCFLKGTDYILTTIIEVSTGRGKPIQYGTCPYSEYSGKMYFDPSEKLKFSFSDSISHIDHNFCISSRTCDMRYFPDFHFKKNSTDFESVNWGDIKSPDTVIDCLTQMMKARKTWVFEIAAHAAPDEDNKSELSKDRAKKIYKQLVANGIEPGRLKWKGFSDKHPYEFQDDFGKIITKDSIAVNERSRRVVFCVVRKDYLPVVDRHHIISGTVTDCKFKEVVPEVTIKLVGSDGSSIETKTDSKGHYVFDSSKVNMNTHYVVSTQVGSDVKTTKSPRGFLNSSDKVKISIEEDSPLNTKNDFCLVPSFGCIFGPPVNYFKKNSSTEYYFDDSLNPADEIMFSVQIMKDNPNLVFEVAGHASEDEKNGDDLALKRSTLIKSILVEKGIEPDRLMIKSYGATMPYDTTWMDFNIPVGNTKEIKEYIHRKSRRVVLSIIRKDYQSGKTIAPEKPPIRKEEEDGE